MRKLLLLILCMVQGALSPLNAQLLYRISGNGTRGHSYLLATNRSVDCSFIDSIPHAFEAYGRCSTVITEFAFEDYELIAALRTAALLPDTAELAHYYRPDEFERIATALTFGYGLGMAELSRLKPAYLTAMYRNELLRRDLGYDELRTMETFFEQVAVQNGTPVIGLDNVDETLYMLFDREPFGHQCRELLSVVDAPFLETDLEREILGLYRRGLLTDIVYAVTGPNNRSTLSYSDYRVFARRNTEWVRRLKPHLRAGGSFITLNAVYLGGDEGLIAALRAEGYRVTPVKNRL